MARNRQNRKHAKSRHGEALEAPSEFGFVSGDTPDPPEATAQQGPGGRRTGTAFRVAWSAFKVAVGIAVVVTTSFATAWGAHRFVLTTPRFQVKSFEVDGNRRFSDDEIGKRAGVEKGQNLFATDVDAAEKKLLEDPWIRSVKVSRKLPNTLVIRLEERDARALALIDGQLFIMTAEGEPFKRLGAGDAHGLPVVTGLSSNGFAIDRTRELERARSAVDVLRQYEMLPLSRVYPAQEVHLEGDGSVTLSVGKRPITLHLGRGPFRQRLLMAARVVGKLQAKGELPGIVFVDNEAHTERVVVRMR